MRVNAQDLDSGKYPPVSDKDMQVIETIKLVDEVEGQHPYKDPSISWEAQERINEFVPEGVSFLPNLPTEELKNAFLQMVENIVNSQLDNELQNQIISMTVSEFYGELLGRISHLGKDFIDEVVYGVDPTEIREKNEWVDRILKGKVASMRIRAQDFDLHEEPEFEEGSEKETITKEEVIEWLWEHQNPTDEEVHEWAEEANLDTDELEAIFYELATDHVKHLKEDEEEPDEFGDVEVSAQWVD